MNLELRTALLNDLESHPECSLRWIAAKQILQDDLDSHDPGSATAVEGWIYLIYQAKLLPAPLANAFLLSILQDTKQGVRARSVAAWGLGFAGAEEYLDQLIGMLVHKTEPTVGRSIAYALGFFTSPASARKVVRALTKVVLDESFDAEVRAYAAESLGAIGHKRPVPVLISVLESQHSQIRFFAARALGWIGDDRALDPLKKIAESDIGFVEDLGQDGYWVRDQAMEAIQNILNRSSKSKG